MKLQLKRLPSSSHSNFQLSPETQSVFQKLQVAFYVFAGFDSAISLVALAHGNLRFPICTNLCLLGLIAVRRGTAMCLLNIMFMGGMCLAILVTYVIAHFIFLPPLELTYLRIKIHPFDFFLNQMNLFSVIVLLVVLAFVWRSKIINDIVRCLPDYRYVIGKDWRLSRHAGILCLLCLFAYLGLWPTVQTTLSGKYHAKALALAQAQYVNGHATESKQIKYYVEWINAGYSTIDEAAKVSAKVTVYDGTTLRSVSTTWLEKE